MPQGFLVREGENLITAEIFLDYEPILITGLFDGGVLWHRAYRRSCPAVLSTIDEPACRPRRNGRVLRGSRRPAAFPES